MDDNIQKMTKYLSEFKQVVENCILYTKFKEDLPFYRNDLVFINKLIEELLKENNPIAIKDKLFDYQTDKILTDYWRQGKCGDLHNEAYAKLKTEVKKMG